MKRIAGLSLFGLSLIVIALLVFGGSASAGRAVGTVTDATALPTEILPSTSIVFKANFTSPDGNIPSIHNVMFDGVPAILTEVSAADINTTDGKEYSYSKAFAGGIHSYSFSFLDNVTFVNTTAKNFEVKYAPSAGDWVVSGPMTVANAAIELKGNLIVASGGILEIKNTTIKFNGDADGKYRVEVQSGGILKASEKTIFSKVTGAKNYNFIAKPGSTLELKNSEVWYVGYAGATNNLTGLYTEAANSLIENCIVGSGHQGVIQDNGNLIIRNTTVKDSTRHNLEGTNAVITADDCTFQHSVDACNVEFFTGTRATVTNCLITDNGHNGFWIKTGVTATIQGCRITGSHQSAIWLDDKCTLTVINTRCDNNTLEGAWINGTCIVTFTNTTFEDNGWNGTWIAGSTVTMNSCTVRKNKFDGVYYINSKLTMDKCVVDTQESQGVAGFDSQCTFTNNYVRNSFKHNFETTNCTSVMDGCTFDASRDACNVEFFVNSKATVKNTKINGAGHNCFWLRDWCEVSLENVDMSVSPHNGIWADYGCKVTVTNCNIHDVPEDGIWIANGTLTVSGCTIKNAKWWGIEAINTTVTLTGTNTMSGNIYGNVAISYPVTVKVQDSKGKAISGAKVTIKDQAKAVVYTGTSDANGLVNPGMLFLTKTGADGKKVDFVYTLTATKGNTEVTQKGTTISSAQTISLVPKDKPKPSPGFEGVLLAAAVVIGLLAVGSRKRA